MLFSALRFWSKYKIHYKNYAPITQLGSSSGLLNRKLKVRVLLGAQTNKENMTDLKCPKCNKPVYEVTLLSNPPQYALECGNCGYKLPYYTRANKHEHITQGELGYLLNQGKTV